MVKKVILYIIGVCFVCFLVFVGVPCVCLMVQISQQVSHIVAAGKKMRSASYYQEAATQLALYCQSVKGEIDARPNYFPPIIRELDPGSGSISPTGAHVVIACGVDHLGYILELDEEASNEQQSEWDLYIYTEGTKELLHTVTVDRQDHIPTDVIVANVIEAYDSQIQKKPRSNHLHKEKIHYLLSVQETEFAYEACQKALESLPGDWWIRLTTACIESKMSNRKEALIKFSKWVDKNPCFRNYSFLACFYFEDSQIPEFAGIVEKALKYPPNEAAVSAGWALATMAYQSGKHELAIRVCDAMAQVPEIAKRRPFLLKKHGIDFKAFKEAIEAKDIASASKWVKCGGEFNPCGHTANAARNIFPMVNFRTFLGY